MKRLLYIILFVFLLNLFLGCGTTHHFLPPRPLEDGEHFLSVNWHINLDSFKSSLLFPDVNYYVGIDNTNTIGLGYQFPFLFTHATYAHYSYKTDDKYDIVFTHFNNLLGLGENSNIELGYSHSSFSNGLWNSYSAGIALGSGYPWLIALQENTIPKNFLFLPILPFVRYQSGGADIAISYNYYYGRTKKQLHYVIDEKLEITDTVFIVRNSDIKNISSIEKKSTYPAGNFYIELENNDTLNFECPSFGVDQIRQYESSYHWYLSKKGFVTYSIYTNSKKFKLPIREATFKFENLIRQWREGKDLELKTLSDEAVETIKNANNLLLDHSIGISIQDYNL